MATLLINISASNRAIKVKGVNLNQTTPKQLIQRLINHKQLPQEVQQLFYYIVGKNGTIIDIDESYYSLEQLGFVNGDTITLATKEFPECSNNRKSAKKSQNSTFYPKPTPETSNSSNAVVSALETLVEFALPSIGMGATIGHTIGRFSSATTDNSEDSLKPEESLWKRLFGKKYRNVYSSIFAPKEVKRNSHLLVQVYFHLYEETEKIKSLAKEADSKARRKGYIPLALTLTKGDKLDVEFNIHGKNRLFTERKSVTWQGSLTKCSFSYHVADDIDVDSLSCEANIFVNGLMIGEMTFITEIVNNPRQLNSMILSRHFNKIFISYAHKDAERAKLLLVAYKMQGIEYFYDRESLKPGDIYDKKIADFINSADLFVLCWSKNAAASEYVAKEKGIALSRAQAKSNKTDVALKICPVSIKPRAELPSDMIKIYHFEQL